MLSHLMADASVKSVAEYAQLFARGGVFSAGAIRWYRGDGRMHRQKALLPSIAREPSTLKREWFIYQRFRQKAAAFLPHTPLTEWDWMLYMRHYDAPTRLLDWTESPLVALYFAVEKASRDRCEGAVWCLNPERLNELAGFERRVYCAGIDPELEVYTPSELKLLKVGTGSTDFKPAALISPRAFARLVAQQGVFTVIHRDAVALEAIVDPSLLARVRIPAAAKARIRKSLHQLGINRLARFPGLQ